MINSLGSSDAMWRWRSWSTLVQVMACCLTAPSHYLNQCWLIISKVLWHSSEDIMIRRFEDYIFKITLRSPRGQWLNEAATQNKKYVCVHKYLFSLCTTKNIKLHQYFAGNSRWYGKSNFRRIRWLEIVLPAALTICQRWNISWTLQIYWSIKTARNQKEIILSWCHITLAF